MEQIFDSTLLNEQMNINQHELCNEHIYTRCGDSIHLLLVLHVVVLAVCFVEPLLYACLIDPLYSTCTISSSGLSPSSDEAEVLRRQHRGREEALGDDPSKVC